MSKQGKTGGYEPALPIGTLVGDQYMITRFLGNGGCGITYQAMDQMNNNLVALKECFSDSICGRDPKSQMIYTEDAEEFHKLKSRFYEESRLLMQCRKISGVMPVYRIFEENNTIYYAMEYLEGITLKEHLGTKEDGRTSLEEILELLKPVFDALVNLHKEQIIHRDISPDNIFICKNGSSRLIDFGSARVNVKGKSRIIDFAKRGFAPPEEYYEELRQGPWTDVYSLAATIYRCITGEEPVNSRERLTRGKYLPSPSECGVKIPEDIEEILLSAMEPRPERRLQDMESFRSGMYSKSEPVKADNWAVWRGERRGDSEEAGEKQRAVYAAILGLEGFYAGQKFKMTGQPLRMGRRSDVCDLIFPLDTPGVSGLHCEIYFDADKECAVLKDLGSTYGTRLLNEELIPSGREIYLKEGEGFIIGDNQIFAIQIYE